MFWLILAVAGWGLAHSVMASLGFKTFLRGVVGDGLMRSYRLFYNLFSFISLVPILYLMISLPNADLYRVPSPWNYLFLAGQGLSALFLLVAVLQTDVWSFAGLRQLFEGERPGALVTVGLYRIVRHPLYTFSLLALWSSPAVSINVFVVYLALTAYILVGIIFEERKLLREFGQAYADYKSVTPMLIPGLKFGGNK